MNALVFIRSGMVSCRRWLASTTVADLRLTCPRQRYPRQPLSALAWPSLEYTKKFSTKESEAGMSKREQFRKVRGTDPSGAANVAVGGTVEFISNICLLSLFSCIQDTHTHVAGSDQPQKPVYILEQKLMYVSGTAMAERASAVVSIIAFSVKG